MLLRFGVENFLSIRDYQEIKFTAAPITDEPTLTLSEQGVSESILPVIAIYGANASGKSNVIGALDYLATCVISSHTREAKSKFPQPYFALDENSAKRPTRVDCDFVIEGTRYHYGFAAGDDRVIEEWLYAWPKGRRQLWFHRSDAKSIDFGNSLLGKNKTIEALTRPNSLFLSAAAQNNHEQLAPVYRYFREKLDFASEHPESHLPDYMVEERSRAQIVDFLRFADVGLLDAKIEEINSPEEVAKFLVDISDALKRRFPDAPASVLNFTSGEHVKRLSLGHAAAAGSPVYLNLGQESRGTIQLLRLLGPAFGALDEANLLIVDELDASLHPLLAIKFVTLFSSQATNKSGAQLLFTTHDTNLLSDNVLRRDEIWFTEKDDTGATHIYPLTDIKTRKTDDIRKGYMQGRFGAIPFLGQLEQLLKTDR
jgi:hypothetical protein